MTDIMNKIETPVSRRSILKNVGLGAAAVAAVGAPLSLFSSTAQAAGAAADYSSILRLKYLTHKLYVDGGTTSALAWQKDIFSQAAAHEAAHITQLQTLIGAGAPTDPGTFTYKGTTGNAQTPFPGFAPFPTSWTGGNDFFLLAALCEDFTIRAIKTQLNKEFGNTATVNMLAQMQSTDARHAGQMRILNGQNAWVDSSPGKPPTVTTGDTTYMKSLVYGWALANANTNPATTGEDNMKQYGGGIVSGYASVFDEPLADFTALNEFLGYFGA